MPEDSIHTSFSQFLQFEKPSQYFVNAGDPEYAGAENRVST